MRRGAEYVIDLRSHLYDGVSFAQHIHTVVALDHELCEPTNFKELP
jgi:hypothetical protein